MDNDPTTAVDDPSVDANKGTTDTDPTTATGQGTDPKVDNPDPSKSDDTTVADGDKKPEVTTKSDDAPASTKLDDDLDDWVSKKGLPKATTDAEKLAYQSQRDEQREFTRTRQAEKEAADAKALSDGMAAEKPDADTGEDEDLDPLEKRVKTTEEALAEERTTRLQEGFYRDNNVTEAESKAILDIFKERVNRPTTPEGKLAAFKYLSSVEALPDLLEQAKARIAAGIDPSTVADEAARKEREKIERESQANSPGRAASSTTTSDKTEDEARLQRFKDRFNSK